jgi:hypothetical protein
MQFSLFGFTHSFSVVIMKEHSVLVCVDYVLMHNEVTCMSISEKVPVFVSRLLN